MDINIIKKNKSINKILKKDKEKKKNDIDQKPIKLKMSHRDNKKDKNRIKDQYRNLGIYIDIEV